MARVALLLATALVASLVLVAVADPDPLLPVKVNLVNYKPDLAELCTLVGENTGCSGCVLGTKGLCSWLAVNTDLSQISQTPGVDYTDWINNLQTVKLQNIGTGNALTHRVTMQCVPAKWAQAQIALYPGNFEDASFLCPADPLKEPMIDSNLNWNLKDTANGVGASGNTGNNELKIQNVSVIWSKTHARKNVNWRTDAGVLARNWTVDRTSRWGKAGGLLRSYAVAHSFERDEFAPKGTPANPGVLGDCSFVNHINDVESVRQTLPSKLSDWPTRVNFGDSLMKICPVGVPGPDGVMRNAEGKPLWSERERFCARMIWDLAASTRCPQYGRPISGICQSAYLAMQINCGLVGTLVHGQTLNLWPVKTAAGITPYFQSSITPQKRDCGNGQPLCPTEQLDDGHVLGLRVVDDSTPYCLMMTPLHITGLMEEILAIDTAMPLTELNNALLGTTYGCPPAAK